MPALVIRAPGAVSDHVANPLENRFRLIEDATVPRKCDIRIAQPVVPGRVIAVTEVQDEFALIPRCECPVDQRAYIGEIVSCEPRNQVDREIGMAERLAWASKKGLARGPASGCFVPFRSPYSSASSESTDAAVVRRGSPVREF